MNNQPFLKPTRFFILFLFIVLNFTSHCSAQSNLIIHFVDVGYGDAILVQFPNDSALLIDAGEAKYNSKLVEYMHSLGIKKLETIIITHPHKNHFEGLFSVVEHFKVHRIFVNGDDAQAEEGYAELLRLLKQKGKLLSVAGKGRVIDGLPEDATLKILHPDRLDASANANSIVSWLNYKDIDVLFTGDIEPKQQDQLIERYEELKNADCIQVPHHGGPISEQFIQAFQDKIFIVSTGKNRWGIPDEENLKRLRGEVYRTDVHGTITLESDGKNLNVKQ